jgi:exodeoxyribonuclease VII large subunit
MQRVDDAMSRLPHTLTALLSRHRRRLVAAAQHIAAKGPLARIRGGLLVIPQLVKRQEQQCCALLAAKRQAVRAMMTALNGLSPLAVLDRGYAVLKREPFHEVIKRVADVRPGDRLTARLADGRLECEITDVLPDAP